MSNNNNNNKSSKKTEARKMTKGERKALVNEIRQSLMADIKRSGGRPKRNGGQRKRKDGSAVTGGGSQHGPSETNFPAFTKSTFRRTEYVMDVNGSVAFNATPLPFNPGLAVTFPIGSAEAAKWTEWKVKSCKFMYKPEVSEYATQGQTGKVILAFDYNAANEAPTTKQQAMDLHRECKMPYEESTLVLSTSAINKAIPKYIRTGAVPFGEDIKLYDGGKLWLCTIGQANTSLCGELHVEYEFEVSMPTLLDAAGGSGGGGVVWSAILGPATLATGVTQALAIHQEVNYIEAVVTDAGLEVTLTEGVYTCTEKLVFLNDAGALSAAVGRYGYGGIVESAQWSTLLATATLASQTITNTDMIFVAPGTTASVVFQASSTFGGGSTNVVGEAVITRVAGVYVEP